VKRKRDIVNRWEGNPVIALDDLPFTSNNIFSAGAIKHQNEYVLLVTIENLEGKTAIFTAKSRDGYHFIIESEPLLSPAESGELALYEKRGVRDARITSIEDKLYITYLGISRFGSILCLVETSDFTSVKKLGVISEPESKAGAIFPEKINGKYARLERPRQGSRIWLSYSKDLFTWGESDIVISPRPGFWDSHYVGCGGTPIAIPEGWLVIYYGIKETSAGPITRLGAMILEKENPCKVLERSDIPIISPRENYERIGDINNYIMSTGIILEDNGELKIYYGAADNCLCLGTTHIDQILKTCSESIREY
jgi:predicted GH43/DUF377 family glycosyl hydrolase